MTDRNAVSRGGRSGLPPDCETQTLGIAFFDLSRIPEWTSPEEDGRVAAFFQEFYGLVADRMTQAGARVIKFIGDAGLVVFPKESAEQSIFALAELREAVRECAVRSAFDAYLNVSVHFGEVLAGTFGPPGHERFDVIGKNVNIAARLGRRGITLSQQAFRCLSPEGREHFQKVSRPTTYRLRP